jgi:PAS domain S-box-containing protein
VVEVTASAAVFAVVAVSGTASGIGAYRTEAVQQSLFYLQILLIAYALTGLAVTGIVARRREAEGSLRKSQKDLKTEVKERRHTESWLRQLLASSPDALVVSKDDGQIVLANEAAERIFLYSREELVGQCVEILLPLRFREKHREHRERYNASPHVRTMGSGIELVACRKDGTEFPAEISLGPMRTEEGLCVFSAIRDVTARKLAERELRESQERFDLAVRGTDAGIWDWDLVTNQVYYSAQWKRILGYEEDEIKHDYFEWERRLHPDDRERALATLHDYLEGKTSIYELEHRLQHKDGSYRWILARGAAVRNKDGKPYRFVGSHLDITERKQSERLARDREAQLLAAQKIQENILPRSAPSVPGFDMAGALVPAEFAAGDYFDYLSLPDGSVGIVVGDVSGHGFSSALLMATTAAHLRSFVHEHSDAEEILEHTNSVLCNEIEEARFVTFLFARLEVSSRTLYYVNAGHPSGYVIGRSGEIRATLESTGLPLAVSPDSDFLVSDPVNLEPGDIVLLTTDGILEANSPADELFGKDRMLEVVTANRHRKASEIIDGLQQAVSDFTEREEQPDDVTVVVVKVD